MSESEATSVAKKEKEISSIARAMGSGIAPELFEHEMVTTSKVLGRESGLKVVIGGDKAKSDGKTVVLPAVGKDKNVSAEAAAVTRGFVNHEAAHARWTNPYTLARVNKSDKHRSVFNGMEDVRIETKFAREYPGSQRQFEAAANATMGMFLEDVKSGKIKIDDKTKLLPMAIAWEGRRQAGFGVDAGQMDEFEKLIGEKGMKAAKTLAEAAVKAESSIDISRYIEKWLGKLSPETEKEREHGDDGSPGPSGGGGIGAPDAGLDASAVGAGVGEDDDLGDMKEAVSRMLGSTKGSAQYTSDMAQDNIAELAPYMATCCRKASPGEFTLEEYQKYLDRNGVHRATFHYRVPPTLDEQRSMGLAMVAEMRGALGPAVRAVKQALERGLIIARERQWDGGMQRGYLDPKRLANVRTGSKNFRRVKSPENLVDTAVTLLIDMSGSMCDEKCVEAMKAAFVFADSLDKVGVPIEILGFTSDRKSAKDPYEILARTGIIDMPIYKTFNESMKASMWKVGLISTVTVCAGGHQNADGDSVLHAWLRLRKRPEPRKVLIVFSDGEPATRNRLGHEVEYDHLKRAVAKVIADGVDVLGIGVLSSAVTKFYPQRVVIRSAQDLPKVAGKMLRELLIPKGTKRRQSRATLRAA